MSGTQLLILYCFIVIVAGTVISSILGKIADYLLNRLNIKKIDIVIKKKEV